MSTTRYVALLRGINVGGNHKVPMAALRSLLEALGYTDVATYLQSGNAVFGAAATDPATIETKVEAAMADTFGFEVAVMVRTEAELAKVAAANPFASEATAEPKRVHALFLQDAVEPGAIDAFDAGRYAPDEVVEGERVLYLHTPGGIGTSKLAAALTPKRLGTLTTARNWRTVEALIELSGG